MTKRKNLKILLYSLVFISTILTVSSVKARNIGNVENFRVNGIKENYLSFLYKTKNDSNYVLNLDQGRGRKNFVVESHIYNANYEKRSDKGKTYEGTRNTHSNWAKAGYRYTLGLKREYIWDKAESINGSWSPDNK